VCAVLDNKPGCKVVKRGGYKENAEAETGNTNAGGLLAHYPGLVDRDANRLVDGLADAAGQAIYGRPGQCRLPQSG
jgi:hypothetical protein